MEAKTKGRGRRVTGRGSARAFYVERICDFAPCFLFASGRISTLRFFFSVFAPKSVSGLQTA